LHPLNGLDEPRLLHHVWIDSHAFCHFPDVVVFHVSLSKRLEVNTVERRDGPCVVTRKEELDATGVDVGQVMLKREMAYFRGIMSQETGKNP
jgi:hypothetical protein